MIEWRPSSPSLVYNMYADGSDEVIEVEPDSRTGPMNSNYSWVVSVLPLDGP
jgi:hypothetical protein